MKRLIFISILSFVPVFHFLGYGQMRLAVISKVDELNEQGREALHQPGGWVAALGYFGEAYRLAQDIDYLPGKADALHYLALLEARSVTNTSEVLAYFREEISIRTRLKDYTGLARGYMEMGKYFKESLMLYREAFGYYQQARSCFEKAGQENASYLACLSELLDYTLHYRKEEALPLVAKIAQVHITHKNYAEAGKVYEEIAWAMGEEKASQLEAWRLSQKAISYYRLADKDLAPKIETLNEAGNIWKQTASETNGTASSLFIVLGVAVGLALIGMVIFWLGSKFI